MASGMILLIVIIVTAVVCVRRSNGSSSAWENKVTSESLLGNYEQAAVAAMGEECAQIGADILAKNGSAVDSAIASLLCEGVASLHSMGLGGGFFMMIWNATTKTAHYLDARETASRHAYPEMFKGNATLSERGGLSVAIPGELLGYWEAHQRFGKLDWKELFQPAIDLCKKGSIINEYLESYMMSKEAVIKEEPTLAEILINPATKNLYKVGDRIRRPRLAETLEKLSASNGIGVQEFYNGSIARDLVREIKAFKGIIDEIDFRNYKVEWQEPIKVKIENMTMFAAPPPSSGTLLAFMMNVLKGFFSVKEEKIMYQRLVETFKWAYAKRTELGDPDFELEVNDLVETLTSEIYADRIRNRIKDNWTSNDPKYYGAVTVNPDDSGTCHICVLAPDGSAVSVTSTINQVFGASFRSESTGIIFNDEMDDFSAPDIINANGIPPSPVNFIKPGKRPLSSMVPTILVDENNDVHLVIGGAGGPKITTAVALIMALNLWSGYDIKEAVDARRIHHQLYPMSIQNEEGFPPSLLDFFHSVGHNSTAYKGLGSAVTAIVKQNGHITANSDYRRYGKTAGF
ncbi:glutathione hydrolase 1 proenzyme-like isoform X2 [Belonocnema kinseyi]|nr:glutathione hydrolase 1 proenzyme-like isoform X2 [Belonocnema kinseyi]